MDAEIQPASKESFRQALERLVRNFQGNEEELTSPGYTEMQARTQFITPFFRALGWDVENREGRPSRQLDVWEEKGPGEGRPDYTFRIGGFPKFFVEAKAPHESLDSERHVLQVKRYAWSTREVFAVILTDFQEFRFYDASLAPDYAHPHRGLLLSLSFTEFLANIDKLWEFSRERVAEGSIDTLLPSDKRSLRFRKLVDDAFLEDMTRWRTELATGIHKRNPALPSKVLTDLVQRLLDRIVFIRVAEDRRILEKNTLLDLALDWEAIRGRKPMLPMLNDLFHQVNEDFNGDIFKPHQCERILLDDAVLYKIIMEFYPPKSPYRFDVIPVDIFGAVYERYLGKNIYIKGKEVRVDDRPEVRKAGGVYYTPKPVVDFIVSKTVGAAIEGKIPKQVEKLRVLDPACGSGSFLIGAYQSLINYYENYYEQHRNEARLDSLYPELTQDTNGLFRLSIWRKVKILRENLYGVDLDPQAVEVTMMNLYLKALEGERALPHKQHILPELKERIRCGNSLIEPDIATEFEVPADEKDHLAPFAWASKNQGFGEIMSYGGFDVVLGNPPYVSFGLRGSKRAEDIWGQYVRKHFPNSAQYKLSTYALFIDRAIQLTKLNGWISFIIPDSFLVGQYFSKLRSFVLKTTQIRQMVFFGRDFWRSGVVGRPVITTLRKSPGRKGGPESNVRVDLAIDPESLVSGRVKTFSYPQSYFTELPLNRFRLFFDAWSKSFVEKLEAGSTALREFASIHTGVQSKIGQKLIVAKNKKGAAWKKGLISGSEVTPFRIHYAGHYLNIDPEKLWSGGWDPSIINQNKILIRQTGDTIVCAIDRNKLYHLNNVHSLVLKNERMGLETLAAVLNSQILNHYYHLTSLEFGRAMAQTDIESLEHLPFRSATVEQERDLSSLVQELESSDEESFAELRSKAEEVVAALYGLSRADLRMLTSRLDDPYGLASLETPAAKDAA